MTEPHQKALPHAVQPVATAEPNTGVIAAVRGSVVDVRFDKKLPPIYSVLRIAAARPVVIEVLAQRDAHLCAA